MHATHSLASLRGQLVCFNLSPKGVPEGMIVRCDGGLVQVNFDPELAGVVTRATSEGDAVTVDAVPFADGHADAPHPLYDLVRLTPGDGGRPVVADGPGEADVTVRGTVVRLNHARRGEVNGAILDTGDFVHLRPHGVRGVGGLRVGQELTAVGEVRPGWSGSRVIEARTANGIDIGKPPHKPHGGPPKHKPHGPKHMVAAR
jgi:hypothetical protein